MRAFPTLKELYFDTEKYDGYIRDRCVFRDDIDIEDTVGLVAQYRNGVTLTYSLNAFMPWEGYRLDINGTKGKAFNCAAKRLISTATAPCRSGLKYRAKGVLHFKHHTRFPSGR
jgi:hypothetical protein